VRGTSQVQAGVEDAGICTWLWWHLWKECVKYWISFPFEFWNVLDLVYQNQRALNAGADIDDSNMSIFDVKEGLFGPLSH